MTGEPGIYGEKTADPDPKRPTMFTAEKSNGERRDFRTEAEAKAWIADEKLKDSDFVALTALRSLNEVFTANERDAGYHFGFILQVLVQAYFESRRSPTQTALHTSPIRTLFAAAVEASRSLEVFPFPGAKEPEKFPELTPPAGKTPSLDPALIAFALKYPAVWPELAASLPRTGPKTGGPFRGVNPLDMILRLLYGSPRG